MAAQIRTDPPNSARVPIQEVHASLLNITLAVRRLTLGPEHYIQPDQAAARADGRPVRLRPAQPRPEPDRPDHALPDQPRWWVLVCGDPLDPYSLDRRDQARDRLRGQAAEHGLGLVDHVWIWDSSGLAQLLAGEYPTLAGAEERARELQAKGLRVRVRPRMD